MTRLADLKPKQRAILRTIFNFRVEHNYGPSIRELRDRVGGAYGVIYTHLKKLQDLGLIWRETATWRAVGVTDEGRAALMEALNG